MDVLARRDGIVFDWSVQRMIEEVIGPLYDDETGEIIEGVIITLEGTTTGGWIIRIRLRGEIHSELRAQDLNAGLDAILIRAENEREAGKFA